MADEQLTRGERSNNPGNLDFHPDIQYVGQLGIEEVPADEHYKPRFARFDNPVHGIRALARNLLVYYTHHKLNTIEELVSRYAPGNENDTTAYIADVSKFTGYSAAEPLNLSDTTTLMRLTQGFIHHENGRCLYTQSTLADAVKSALGMV